ncbi:hypothetical protein ACS0TY_034690 [Phlomoides rotata]
MAFSSTCNLQWLGHAGSCGVDNPTPNLCKSSCSHVMQLKSDMERVQISNQFVIKFLHSLKAKVDKLTLIDSPMSDNDFTIYVINGPGLKFRDIVAYVRAHPHSIHFSILLDMLVAQETYGDNLDNTVSNLSR